MKKFFKFLRNLILILIAALVNFAGIGLGILTLLEYKPDDVTTSHRDAEETLAEGDKVRLLTWNVGYGCLSATEDFFMDGGTKVKPDSIDLVWDNLQGIAGQLTDEDADIYLLQETDVNSDRSYHINEREYFEKVTQLTSDFGCNFNSIFTPYPIPPIGKVESGLVTLSRFDVSDVTRISLPCPFKWPVRTVNLKRCLLETRIPLKDSDRELVIINLHLEAYDSGEGKIAQTKMLSEKLAEEYAKGNYVIAGGDFNQVFDNVDSPPIKDPSKWAPGSIEAADLPDGFSFATTDNCATCRLLDAPLTADTQLYIIDGFIVSDNLKVEVLENVDAGFIYSDHNPVRLEVELLP